MSDLLEGVEQLEQELTPEPVMAPAVGSIALHFILGAALVFYGILAGSFITISGAMRDWAAPFR